MIKVKVHIFRVFTNEKGKFGNPVGIVLDEKQEISSIDRQAITTDLGFSESVFINDLKTGNVSLFNPQKEVDFAGHALVGTGYFLNKTVGQLTGNLECRAGVVKTWQEGSKTWIEANLESTPPWKHEQFQKLSLIESLTPNKMASKEPTIVWAWVDKIKGVVRARTFAPDWGIPEDEANGSGPMQLAAQLGRKLEIRHGKGSVIYAKPAEDELVGIGGMVKEDEVREVVIK